MDEEAKKIQAAAAQPEATSRGLPLSVPLLLAIIDGAITLIERYRPIVLQLFQQGLLTPEQQQKLQSRITALSGDGVFSGPEWQVQPTPQPDPQPAAKP